MASYKAVLKESAVADLRAVPFPFRRQINIGLNKLKLNPRPEASVRLDEGEYYYLRVSGWVVVYEIDDEACSITIIAIVK